MKLPKEYIIDTPIRKGHKGAKVKLIQEWLSLNGISVSIDKNFGSATERGIQKFQASKNISVTGTIDKITFDEMIAPMRRALSDISENNLDFNQLVVKYAEQHCNENPREIGNPNCGPWVRLYMNGNEGEQWFWCAGFAMFIIKQSAEILNLSIPFNPTFSCDNIAFQAKKNGFFLSEKNSKPELIKSGSLFIKRNSPGDWVHTGIVIQAHADSFETIEGNTNDDGSRDGYEVCRRVRGYESMDFVVL
jgi:hypothetical protein